MSEELIKALNIIKEECQKHERDDVDFNFDCRNCPMFCSYEGCALLCEYPSHWNIPEAPPKKVSLLEWQK